jgi:hypothetical protein
MPSSLSSFTGSTDPIITAMLSNRQVPDDLTPEQEQETRERLYVMLRHSKKYKKMQVVQANEKWQSECDADADPFSSSQTSSQNLLKDLGALDLSYDSGVDVDSRAASRTASISSSDLYKKRDRRVSFSDKIEFHDCVATDTEPTKLFDKLVKAFKNIL